MSDLPPELARQLEQQFSTEKFPPIVRFYDHAIRDEAKSAECGRDRFKPAVYIEKITRKSTVREVFSRKMIEEDKREFSREWEIYRTQKEAFTNRKPLLEAMPGLDAVSHAELKSLGLTDCEKIAEYSGDLFELEPFRITAKKIMEISNGNLHPGREEISNSAQRPLHFAGSVPGAGGNGTFHRADACQEGESFRYEIKVA